MRTLRGYLLLVLVLSTLLAGCSLSLPGTSTTPTVPPRAQLSPAWTAVLNQIGPNGEVSLATALQAYTLVFGPLPGVQAPASDSGLIGSGTLAAYMILRHYSDLSPTQQQAVLQRLGLTAPASVEAHPSLEARVQLAAPAQRGVQAQAAARAPAALPTPVPTDGPGMAPFRAMVNAYIPQYNALLAYTLSLPIRLTFDANLKKGVEGWTVPVGTQGDWQGTPVLCHIHLNPVIGPFPLAQQQFIIAHELFHCYQSAIIGSGTTVANAPDWLLEGSANWAGAIVSGATDTIPELQAFWAAWLELENPDHPLFERTNNAIGFFAVLDQAGISPWKVLPAMLLSQTKGKVPDNVAAYQAGTQSAPQQVLDQWASSYERDPSLGAGWDLTGPAILPRGTYGQIADQPVTLTNGGSLTVVTPAYTASLYGLTSQADVMHVSINGTSRLHDSASFERVTSADGNYCTKQGGCACPPGSAYQGPALPQLTGLVHLAVTGGPQGANGTVSGLTLQQFCNKQKPTSAPTITAAFCQSFLTVAQANAIMQPAKPATTIHVESSRAVATCNYEYASLRAVVSVLFAPYNQQVSLDTIVSQSLAQVVQNGAVVTKTPVSGVGDQAFYVTGTIANPPYSAYYIDMTYGGVYVSCFDTFAGLPATSQQAPLIQVCKQVVNVLDP